MNLNELKKMLSEINFTDEAKVQLDEIVDEAEKKGLIDQGIVLKLVRVLESDMEKDSNFAEAAGKIVDQLQQFEDGVTESLDELTGDKNESDIDEEDTE